MDLAVFEKKIGYTFQNKKLLETVFTHRSYLNENRGPGMEHNERLEFLGDAVLELVSTEYLYKKYPDKAEGDLTAFRAALVNTVSIAEAAARLEMNDFLRLSRGESRDVGRARNIILANSFEALLGAYYLDAGYEKVSGFIAEQILFKTESIIRDRTWQDAKSKFQELSQEHTGTTPSYIVVDQTGPDHERRFVIAACIGSERVAIGDGHSKQEAEQSAAQKAILVKGW
ncbi:MAG: ribonuclease ribonuclease [Candidatus Kaiserbacteria bacterium]|nr:ribonuclease ribonuclease [Candidatus Kaiserbacteria bacterium]